MNKKIKTLIIYETGIHDIIIINEKKEPPNEQNYIQSLKRVAPLYKKGPLSQLEIDFINR